MTTSAQAVISATGHDHDYWYARFDAWQATRHQHKEIVAWLMAEQGVDSWWAQSITVGYEQARGLRAPGSGRNGLFQVSASKTVAVSVDDAFAAFADPKIRRKWLSDADLTERTAQPGRSIRFDYGSTRVVVGFDAKGPAKCQVSLLQERLPDAESAEKAKAYWRDRVAALKSFLEG